MTATESRASDPRRGGARSHGAAAGEKPQRTSKMGWLANAKEYMDSRAGLDYLMLRIIIFLLIGIGIIMVFSSSMATSYVESTGVWTEAIRQTLMVVAGLFMFWLALRIRPSFVRKLVPWLLALSIVLLIAVLIPGIGTGRDEVGSQSWIILGPASIQPSELARVAIGSMARQRWRTKYTAISACVSLSPCTRLLRASCSDSSSRRAISEWVCPLPR